MEGLNISRGRFRTKKNNFGIKKKKSLFNSKRIYAFGRVFDSKMEYEFYAWLKNHKFDFDCQVKYNLFQSIKLKASVPLLNCPETRPSGTTIKVDFVIRVNLRNRKNEIITYTIIVETKGFHKKRIAKVKDSKTAFSKNPKYTEYMLRYNMLAHKLYRDGETNHLIRIVQKEHMPLFRIQLIALISKKLNIKDFFQIKY